MMPKLKRLWRHFLCFIDWHTPADDYDVHQGEAPLYTRTYTCRHCDGEFEI